MLHYYHMRQISPETFVKTVGEIVLDDNLI